MPLDVTNTKSRSQQSYKTWVLKTKQVIAFKSQDCILDYLKNTIR